MKTLLLVIGAAVIGITLLASAAVYSVTIDSAWSVDEQVEELMQYIAKLPKESRANWAEKAVAAFERQEHDPKELPLTLAQVGAFQQNQVYISPSGKAYHRSKDCRGLRFTDKITKITLEEAKMMKREPCKLCAED